MLNVRTGAVAALMVVACAVSACSKQPAADKTTAEPAAKPATGEAVPAEASKPPDPPKPVPETLPPVVARVNGQDIPKTEFDRVVRQMELQSGQPVPQNRRDEVYRAILDQLVTYTALVPAT